MYYFEIVFTQDQKSTEQTWTKWTRDPCLWIERVQMQGSAKRERRATAAASRDMERFLSSLHFPLIPVD